MCVSHLVSFLHPVQLFFDYRYNVSMDNDLIIKPGIAVEWMDDPKMAREVSKKQAARKS